MPAIFEDLRVWQEARRLTKDVYIITDGFPASEQYGLVSQLRRAAVSVMSNIAEGQGRYSRQEFIRFLLMSRGSLWEVRSLCILSHDLGFVQESDLSKVARACDKIGLMLGALIDTTRSQMKSRGLTPKA